MLGGQSVALQISLGKQEQTLHLGLVPTFPLWGTTLHTFPSAGYFSLASAPCLGLEPGLCPSSVLPMERDAWGSLLIASGTRPVPGHPLPCCLEGGWGQKCTPSKGGAGLQIAFEQDGLCECVSVLQKPCL